MPAQKRKRQVTREVRAARKLARTCFLTDATEEEKKKALQISLQQVGGGKKYSWLEQKPVTVAETLGPERAREIGITSGPIAEELKIGMYREQPTNLVVTYAELRSAGINYTKEEFERELRESGMPEDEIQAALGPPEEPPAKNKRAPKRKADSDPDGEEWEDGETDARPVKKARKKQTTKASEAAEAPKAPRKLKEPKAPRAPRAPKAPKAPKEPKAPRAPRAPRKPRAPKAPKEPKEPQTPKAPAKTAATTKRGGKKAPATPHKEKTASEDAVVISDNDDPPRTSFTPINKPSKQPARRSPTIEELEALLEEEGV